MALGGPIVQYGPYIGPHRYEVLLPLDYKAVLVLGQHCSKIVATRLEQERLLIIPETQNNELHAEGGNIPQME